MATSNVISGSVTASGAVNAASAAITGLVGAGSLTIGGTQTVGGRVYASVADSTPVAMVAAGTSTFSTMYSLPAKTLGLGSELRVRAVARVTADTVAGTSMIVLSLGGTTIGVSQALAAAIPTGARCVIDVVLTSRAAAGAAVALSGVGTAVWSTATGVVTTYPGAAAAVPTFATDAALSVTAAVVMVGGGSSGTFVLEQLVVDVVA